MAPGLIAVNFARNLTRPTFHEFYETAGPNYQISRRDFSDAIDLLNFLNGVLYLFRYKVTFKSCEGLVLCQLDLGVVVKRYKIIIKSEWLIKWGEGFT
jgi:hypothetical protein